MDFVGGTADVFGSLPDIVGYSRNLDFVHPVGPHEPGAEPLRMIDHDMKRRPLDGNVRALEPEAHFCENIVNEALIARVVDQPVHNVAVRLRSDGIDVWRGVHVLFLSGVRHQDMSCRRPTVSTGGCSTWKCRRPGMAIWRASTGGVFAHTDFTAGITTRSASMAGV